MPCSNFYSKTKEVLAPTIIFQHFSHFIDITPSCSCFATILTQNRDDKSSYSLFPIAIDIHEKIKQKNNYIEPLFYTFITLKIFQNLRI